MLRSPRHSFLSSCQVVDYALLERMVSSSAGDKPLSSRFEYTYINDVIFDQVVVELAAFPSDGRGGLKPLPKMALDRIMWEFNSGSFINAIAIFTGIGNLLPDPHCYDAGFFTFENGAMLDIASDTSLHPEFGLRRAVTIVLCLKSEIDFTGLELSLKAGSLLVFSTGGLTASELSLVSKGGEAWLIVAHYYIK